MTNQTTFNVGDKVINLTSQKATVLAIDPELGILLEQKIRSKSFKWWADPAKTRLDN